MFQDLDSTLSVLIKSQLLPSLAQQVTISFATPDNEFPPSGVSLPAVNLFLYDMSENRELRLTPPRTERALDGRVVSYPAPVRVDCTYLVTAWPKAGVPSPDQDEHQLLGEVLKVLLRFREIPAEALQGGMKGLALPIRTMIGPMSGTRGRGELWQALNHKPRAVFQYVVTLAVDVSEPEDVGALVTEMRI